MLTIQEILEATKGKLLSGNPAEIVTGISTDTRKINKGEMFIAIKGERFDGHSFILEAVSKGVSGVLVQDGCITNANFKLPEINVIAVNNSIKALGDIGHFYRMKFDIPVVGITGSNGKTTTKEMITSILTKRFNVLKNTGTENNNIGVPMTLIRLNNAYEVAVIELGMNHIGEIYRLAEIARPTAALITNIGPSHLEYLEDMETVFRAKSEMLKFLPPDSPLIINGDDKFLKRLNGRFKIRRFGLDRGFDFYADKIMMEPEGVRFRLNGKYDIELNVLGKHNVYNALAAIAIGAEFGIQIDNIQDALKEFRVPHMRMEVKTIGDIKIINDTYNANPSSMKQAIEALRDMSTKGRKILVAGDMLELGNLSARFHHLVGRQAAEAKIDFIVAIGKLAEYIGRGAIEAGMSENRIKLFGAVKEAVDTVANFIKKGDTVLVKGSRAMKMEEIVQGLEEEFGA